MKKIETAAVYGLGALGMLFGSSLQKKYGADKVRFVMDSGRYARHKEDRYTINDEPFDFALQDIADVTGPSDLVIVAVKGVSLPEVIEMMEPSVGDETIIISLMNGITSEDMIAEKYGNARILDCIAIGMDAMREGTDLHYTQHGKLQIGSRRGDQPELVEAVAQYLQDAGVPYEIRTDIRHAMWHKFMLNVGVNQACTAYETDYGHVTSPGPLCEEMKEAMSRQPSSWSAPSSRTATPPCARTRSPGAPQRWTCSRARCSDLAERAASRPLSMQNIEK